MASTKRGRGYELGEKRAHRRLLQERQKQQQSNLQVQEESGRIFREAIEVAALDKSLDRDSFQLCLPWEFYPAMPESLLVAMGRLRSEGFENVYYCESTASRHTTLVVSYPFIRISSELSHQSEPQ